MFKNRLNKVPMDSLLTRVDYLAHCAFLWMDDFFEENASIDEVDQLLALMNETIEYRNEEDGPPFDRLWVRVWDEASDGFDHQYDNCLAEELLEIVEQLVNGDMLLAMDILQEYKGRMDALEVPSA